MLEGEAVVDLDGGACGCFDVAGDEGVGVFAVAALPGAAAVFALAAVEQIGAEVELALAVAVEDGIQPVTCGVGVVARAALEGVVAFASAQNVVSSPAKQCVITVRACNVTLARARSEDYAAGVCGGSGMLDGDAIGAVLPEDVLGNVGVGCADGDGCCVGVGNVVLAVVELAFDKRGTFLEVGAGDFARSCRGIVQVQFSIRVVLRIKRVAPHHGEGIVIYQGIAVGNRCRADALCGGSHCCRADARQGRDGYLPGQGLVVGGVLEGVEVCIKIVPVTNHSW